MLVAARNVRCEAAASSWDLVWPTSWGLRKRLEEEEARARSTQVEITAAVILVTSKQARARSEDPFFKRPLMSAMFH